MRKYRIAKNQSFRAGEEIRLEKITTADKILEDATSVLIFLIAVLFLFNLKKNLNLICF